MTLRPIPRFRPPPLPAAAIHLDGGSAYALEAGTAREILSWLFARPDLLFRSPSGKVCLRIRAEGSGPAERRYSVSLGPDDPPEGERLPANLVFERPRVDAFEVGDALRDYLLRFPSLDGRVRLRSPALPA